MIRLLRSAPAAALFLLAALAACTPRPYDADLVPKLGREITAAQIQRMSGANAWDVLRASGLPLTVVPSSAPGATRLTRRGLGSLHFEEDPIVVLDGVRLSGVEALLDVRKTHIESIRLLSGLDASIRYGTGSRGGAIVIETRRLR